MLAEDRKKSLWLAIPALFLQVGCMIVSRMVVMGDSLPQWLLTVSSIVSTPSAIVVVVGLCYFARGKGYHPAWGLLGIASFLGMGILCLFPDKTKNHKALPSAPVHPA